MKHDPEIFLNPRFTKVFVDRHEQEFGVHKQLLCQYAGHFRSAYDSETQEAQQDMFRLPEVNAQAFASLLSWLYTGEIYLDPSKEEPTRPATPSEGSAREEAQKLAVLESSAGEDPDYDSPSDASDYGEPDIETEDTLDTVSEAESQQPAAGNFEAAALSSVGGSDITRLDVYQLQALIQQVPVMPEWADLLPRWEQMLAKKRSEAGDQDVTMVDSIDIPNDWEKLINLYILANDLDVLDLRNQVLDCIQEEHDKESQLVGGTPLPPFGVVATAFARLPATSRLRQWLIDAYSYRLRYWKYSAAQISALPREFLVSMLLINAERAWYHDSSAKPDFDVDLCLYHDHRNDEEKAACQKARETASESDNEPDEAVAPGGDDFIKKESAASDWVDTGHGGEGSHAEGPADNVVAAPNPTIPARGRPRKQPPQRPEAPDQ